MATVPNLARIDPLLLYPPFLVRLCLMLESLNDAGAEFMATEGFRAMSRSAKLYFQGRVSAGPKVTNAKPGYSAHNYGLGTDLCRIFGSPNDKHAVSWEPEDYEVLGDEARRAGLEWGGDWKSKDCCHVQWPGFVHESELEPLKAIYDKREVSVSGQAVQNKAWLHDVWALVSSLSDTQPDIPLAQLPKPEVS